MIYRLVVFVGNRDQAVGEFADRRVAQPDQQHQREHTVGADLAVAHDGELGIPVATTAESIRRIRKPVFMQAAGTQGSEEHTPALQSLMRISYAVFCL